MLALLGILVGTASVVALVSSSQLATQHALEQFTNLGTNLFAISLSPNGAENKERSLDLKQLRDLQNNSSGITAVAPYVIFFSELSFAGRPMSGSLMGVTEALSNVLKITTTEGRFISRLDRAQYFCVVGANIAQKIRAQGINPLHQQIRVGEHYFTIIGIAQPWAENMFVYANLNDSIIVPIEAASNLDKNLRIQNIIFKLQEGVKPDQVQIRVENRLQQLMPGTRLFSRSAKQLIDGMQKQRQTFNLLLIAVGSISLVVGGIGVMNIMLVSVLERRREIGIRMAIGARRCDIQQIFLIDAIVLTLVGGMLGMIVGVLISLMIALFSHWTFHLYWLPLVIGFSISVLVGVFFGYYPAYSAARLDPIQALRAD